MDKPVTPVKKQPKAGSVKQKRAVALMVENGGNVSKAMRDAGYSEATAKTPQKLTQSDYVQSLMAEVGLTDIDGFQVLKDGLQAETPLGTVDHNTRHKYLETFIKVKGFARETETGNTNFNFINVSKTDNSEYGI